jgi:beta-lactamase class A
VLRFSPFYYNPHQDQVSYPFRLQNSPYTFINPLLYTDSPESKQFAEYSELEKKMSDYINTNQRTFKVDDVSIYFRNLTFGRWVGINENDTFAPHSLLKVPYLVAYLKKAESTPNLLESKLTYTPALKETIDKVQYENNSDLVVGLSYPIKELLRRMIVQSDNVAKDILLANIDTRNLDEVFSDLGIQVPSEGDYQISTKTYALFFRILYNSTYLDRSSSEWALQLLNNSEFEYGLRASIPANIKIAHKYGIDAPSGTGTNLLLHDCGIIYKSQSPYLLCIMTKGHNAQGLSDMISGISNLVYADIGKN